MIMFIGTSFEKIGKKNVGLRIFVLTHGKLPPVCFGVSKSMFVMFDSTNIFPFIKMFDAQFTSITRSSLSGIMSYYFDTYCLMSLT